MEKQKTLVIKIDWGLWRVIAMTWAITEVAKKRPVKVITSRPLVFRSNPYIESVHGLEDRHLFENVIKWNDYIELEPYIEPRFFNDGVNWLDIASEKLWLDKVAQPILFMAEHEKYNNILNAPKPILYQPFWSTMEWNWCDRSYRSIKVEDAQYIANQLREKWFNLFLVIKPWQPILQNCEILDTPDLRWVITLCDRYPLVWADSCLQHATKAFNKPSVVVRAGTDKERFWYDLHTNLREHPMVAHTPMRLPMNSRDYDISNQYTNKFSKEFLDKIVNETEKLVNENWVYNSCDCNNLFCNQI